MVSLAASSFSAAEILPRRLSQDLQVVDRRFEPRRVTGVAVLELLQTFEFLSCPGKVAFFQSALDSFDCSFPFGSRASAPMRSSRIAFESSPYD